MTGRSQPPEKEPPDKGTDEAPSGKTKPTSPDGDLTSTDSTTEDPQGHVDMGG